LTVLYGLYLPLEPFISQLIIIVRMKQYFYFAFLY
jgi:hypothetical protein